MGKEYDEDAARRARWAQRKIEMRRQKRRQELFRKALLPGAAVFFVIIITIVIAVGSRKKEEVSGKGQEAAKQETIDKEAAANEGVDIHFEQIVGAEQENAQDENAEDNDSSETGSQTYEFTVTENTISLGENVVSSNAIFVDIASQTILARKDETSRIVPASMTKVLTLLVAV